jgi:hypothetical protein
MKMSVHHIQALVNNSDPSKVQQCENILSRILPKEEIYAHIRHLPENEVEFIMNSSAKEFNEQVELFIRFCQLDEPIETKEENSKGDFRQDDEDENTGSRKHNNKNQTK